MRGRGIMLRSGTHGVYNNKEYYITRNIGKDKVKLLSKDEKDLEKGFEYVKEKHYTKIVPREEITAYIRITPKCRYKDHIFYVLTESKEREELRIGLIGSQYADLCKKLGFQEVDRGVYEKWVLRSEVDGVWEEKIEKEDYGGHFKKGAPLLKVRDQTGEEEVIGVYDGEKLILFNEKEQE